MNSPAGRVLNPQFIGVLVALVDQGRLGEAEYRAEAELRLHPENGILWKILSVALLRQGKDALPALRRAAALLPDDSEAHANLGTVLHDQRQWAGALDSLQRAVTLNPQDVSSLVLAADAMRELGQAEQSLPLYHKALRLEPGNTEARNNLGNAFLQLGQYADAAGCYRLALQQTPNSAKLLCNLGTAQRHLGYLDEALATTREAVALDPTSSALHTQLGLVLAAGGDRDGAMESYRQALIRDSNDVDALNNLANMLRDLGYRRDAIALYARAVKADPQRAQSHCNLGIALFEMRRTEDAMVGFRQALALQPRYAPAYLNLGLAMRQARRPDEAEANCRAALAIDPDDVEALVLQGELHADRGHFAEAEESFQRALALNPQHAPAYTSIATHRKMTVADREWGRSAEALLGKPLPVSIEMGLRYALGKYFDDLGHYTAAFGHYRLANELSKRLAPAYDGQNLRRYVQGITQAFGAPRVPRESASEARRHSPLFVVGMPRSGTSLAEQILASHPVVFGAGEVPFWNAAYGAHRDAERKSPGAGVDILAQKAEEYATLMAGISGGAERVVDKLPANFLYLGMIQAAFPDARFIHMTRHPIDTCLSIYFQNFFNVGPYANDLESLADYYRQYASITRHWREVLPASTLLEVPYEGLLDDQEGWTRRMLEFAGLPWDPACLAFDTTERVVITASKWQVRQKLHKGSRGRWRHYAEFVGPLMQLQDLIPSTSRT